MKKYSTIYIYNNINSKSINMIWNIVDSIDIRDYGTVKIEIEDYNIKKVILENEYTKTEKYIESTYQLDMIKDMNVLYVQNLNGFLLLTE